MRRCVMGLWIIAAVLVGGCTILDPATGTNADGTRNPFGAIIDTVVGAASSSGLPWLTTVGALVGWGIRERRHALLIAAGKRDDDGDGFEDPPKPPPVLPA